MKTLRHGPVICAIVLAAACTEAREPSDSDAHASIDSLNSRLVQAYRNADPRAYAELYTDSAVFEWPALNAVRGRSELEQMARNNWSSLADMDLELSVASRRIAPAHATEFGAFRLSWRDSARTRMMEYGRYAVLLARDGDDRWRIDRFFGFADSTRPLPAPP